MNKKKVGINKAEYKIHNYLDVVNYFTKIQEDDMLTYYLYYIYMDLMLKLKMIIQIFYNEFLD